MGKAGYYSRTRELVQCPACGKQGLVKGLMGGACSYCRRTARDRALGTGPLGTPLEESTPRRPPEKE